MVRPFLFFLTLLISKLSIGQNSFFEKADSIHWGRFSGVSTGIATTWGGGMIGLDAIWYSKVEKSPWNTFNDNHEWLQMDKVGHFYAAYKLNQVTSELYQWSGVKRNNALWFGAGVSIGFQTTLEFLDGHTKDWGWSWGDVAANSLGTISYTAQQLIWNEERIIPKFSTHTTPFAEVRPNVLGSNFTESLLKDYNGQTYWLSFSPGTFWKQSKIPEWACLSFGYSVHEKLVGSESTFIHPETGYVYREQREFLFSLDIDFSKLPIKKPWLKVLVKQFNYLKVPFPTLMIRDGEFIGKPFYF